MVFVFHFRNEFFLSVNCGVAPTRDPGGANAWALPFDDGGEVLRDEGLVVLFDGVDVDRRVRLGVEVVRVEFPHGREQPLVAWLHEVGICVLAVPSEEERREEGGQRECTTKGPATYG